MRPTSGEANITIIVIVLIGLAAATETILITTLLNYTIYSSSCNQNGEKFKT